MPTTPQDVILLGSVDEAGVWTGVTTDETTSKPIAPGNHAAAAIVLISNGTTSGGNVSIEEAYFTPPNGKPYTGTWSVIQSVAASSFTGGAQRVVHISPNALFPIRVRIADAITGGGGVSAVLRYQ